VFTEQRQSARKVVKVKAVVTVDGGPPITGRTLDLGSNGVCVNAPEPVPAGKLAQVSFDLLIDGKAYPIHARSKVSYCIFSNGEFKIGLQFLTVDLSAMTTIAKYLR
jgi:hypothetical protein